MGTVHLRGPGGVTLAYDLPLHETIERQWADGTLLRVEEDGSPFQGDDPFAVLDGGGEEAVTEETGGSGGDEPVRPAQNAPKGEWVAYAVALGLFESEDEANAKTKADLVAATTPPELNPPDPGE